MIPLIHTLNADPGIAEGFGGGGGGVVAGADSNTSPLCPALALGADLGGNGTLIGSSADAVAARLSEKFGHRITFNRWFKTGFPLC